MSNPQETESLSFSDLSDEQLDEVLEYNKFLYDSLMTILDEHSDLEVVFTKSESLFSIELVKEQKRLFKISNISFEETTDSGKVIKLTYLVEFPLLDIVEEQQFQSRQSPNGKNFDAWEHSGYSNCLSMEAYLWTKYKHLYKADN